MSSLQQIINEIQTNRFDYDKYNKKSEFFNSKFDENIKKEKYIQSYEKTNINIFNLTDDNVNHILNSEFLDKDINKILDENNENILKIFN